MLDHKTPCFFVPRVRVKKRSNDDRVDVLRSPPPSLIGGVLVHVNIMGEWDGPLVRRFLAAPGRRFAMGDRAIAHVGRFNGAVPRDQARQLPDEAEVRAVLSPGALPCRR